MEFDPPRRLVREWRSLYNPELAAEEASRVTWEIEPHDGGDRMLTGQVIGLRVSPQRSPAGLSREAA
jgi:hypothetical protein